MINIEMTEREITIVRVALMLKMGEMNTRYVSAMRDEATRDTAIDLAEKVNEMRDIVVMLGNARNVGFWCSVHNRAATFVDAGGRIKCDPRLGGILLPCAVIPLEKEHASKR